MSLVEYDYGIIGGGIIGLTVAHELIQRHPKARILLIEKESEVAEHASGRNSGVLHAGFYYTADSLKARFTQEGNKKLRAFCTENKINLNECGKVVVASEESDLEGLEELKRRGDKNGVTLDWITTEELSKIEPLARTIDNALYSPTTATVNPLAVCLKLKEILKSAGVEIHTNTAYQGRSATRLLTNRGTYSCAYIINCAGLYADKIAKDFGFSKGKTILPFKGIYLKQSGGKGALKTNIYPVPNLKNPFLGVHFTVTEDESVKLGPTAIPAFWRENYKGWTRFNIDELLTILYYQTKLFLTNSFGFRNLALTEIKKYHKATFVNMAHKLVQSLSPFHLDQWSKPGIRAQLLDTESLELIQDFVLEGDSESLHVLNAVSPAFTCSMPMATHIANKIEALRNL